VHLCMMRGEKEGGGGVQIAYQRSIEKGENRSFTENWCLWLLQKKKKGGGKGRGNSHFVPMQEKDVKRNILADGGVDSHLERAREREGGKKDVSQEGKKGG